MNRDIRKLIKKVDELQKQLNQQNESIMDQSIIIQKLIEKLTIKDPLAPFKPPFGTPWDSIPDYNTPKIVPNFPYDDKSTPWAPQNVKCPHCQKDTGIPFVLHMVIPPEGLNCPWCHKVAVRGNTITCMPNQPYTTTTTGTDTTTLRPYENVCGSNINTSTTNFDPSIKGYNNRTTTPIYSTAYDGTKSILPVNTLPDNE